MFPERQVLARRDDSAPGVSFVGVDGTVYTWPMNGGDDGTPTVRELWARVEGSSAPYVQAGDHGPPVILMHGAGGDRHDWDGIVSGLATQYRVFAPELIGCGESPRENIRYTLAMFREFVIGFMDELGLDNTALVGHSLGGRIGLEVAAEAPQRIGRLVLAAPLGFGPLSLVGRIATTSVWAVHKTLGRALPYPDMELDLDDRSFDFRRVAQPTLVIWGSRDIYFPPSHGWRALRTLSDARLKVYKGAGHSPHAAYPEHFTADVHRFLSNA